MKFREGFRRIVHSKSRTFLVFCFSFLSGIAFASLREQFIFIGYLIGGSIVFLCAAIVWRESSHVRLILLAVLCGVLGIIRYQLAFPANTSEHIHTYVGQEVTIAAFVSSEPDIRTDGVRYRVRTEKFIDSHREIQGEVYVKSELYPRYAYGEQLIIQCTIERPEPIEDVKEKNVFRYDRYLSRINIYAICKNPVIETTEKNMGNPLYRSIFSFKTSLADTISHIWHEPYASFVAGLLYGYRGGLGSLNELFAVTGVTHIVAISGYNITIIATIFIALCKTVYIPRKKAFGVVVVGIILFVIFTGASASVVRAGIMGILVLIARQSGRRSGIGNVLMMTAVIMAMQNPFVLIWDAGFQLSFLATAGLVYLSPIVESWFTRVPGLFGAKESLVSTLAAIIATLPLILFQFGRLSVVAPIVNVLILWLIPWVMIAGSISVVLAYVFLPIGRIAGILAYLGMEYIVQVVTFFSDLPFAAFDLKISWFIMIISYILLGMYIRKKAITRVV